MGLIIFLLLLGDILVLAELLFIPGTIFTGLLGLGSIVGSCYLAYTNISPTVSIIIFLVNIALLVVATLLLLRAKTWKKLSLETKIESRIDDKPEEKGLSIGQEGESYLQLLDLNSGAVERIASLPDDEFGEGITHFGDRIYQLTWTSRKAYVYDLEGRLLKTIRYNGEGWGITTDGKRLFLSDGSSTIREIDPETFATKRSILVSFNGQPLDYINELEWANGKIWANIYLTSAIVEINPTTGIVEGYVDLPELRSRLKDNPEAEAFNGVAYNPTSGRFYVTGKDWNKIFEIEIVK